MAGRLAGIRNALGTLSVVAYSLPPDSITRLIGRQSQSPPFVTEGQLMCRQSRLSVFVSAILFLAIQSSIAAESRVRVADICTVETGRTEAKLTGIGLVVGLDGTGDGEAALSAIRRLAAMGNLLGFAGGHITDVLDPDSVAIVAVEVTVPATGATKGQKFDCAVTCLGRAKSLKGGRLLVCRLTHTAGGNSKAVSKRDVVYRLQPMPRILIHNDPNITLPIVPSAPFAAPRPSITTETLPPLPAPPTARPFTLQQLITPSKTESSGRVTDKKLSVRYRAVHVSPPLQATMPHSVSAIVSDKIEIDGASDKSGEIAGGATLQTDYQVESVRDQSSFTLVIDPNYASFAAAADIARVVNVEFQEEVGNHVARARAADRVEVRVPTQYRESEVEFFAYVL